MCIHVGHVCGSQVDSGQEVSCNGFIFTVSCLDAELTAALAWEADPLGARNSLFPLRWHTMWSLK